MLFSFYFLSISLCIFYLFLIRTYLINWRLVPTPALITGYDNLPFISIIVAARNEEIHISDCLLSIVHQDYPRDKFEIIVVDDHSTDSTVLKIKSLQLHYDNLKCISIKDRCINKEVISYKREAIKRGIEESKATIILLTDADCEVPPAWIKLMSYPFIHQDCVFVGGPVVISCKNQHILTSFQALDMIGMMIITGAGFQSGNQLLANGANMAFSKEAFYETGGYTTFPEKASGDDIFLLHQLHKAFPGKIKFIKSLDGTVKTQPVMSFQALINQRIRWASKNRVYQELTIKLSLFLVFLISAMTLLSGLFSFLYFNHYFPLFLLLFSAKFLGDYLLQKEAIYFFKESRLLKYVMMAQIMHTIYIISIGIMGNLNIRYPWKGRMVK